MTCTRVQAVSQTEAYGIAGASQLCNSPMLTRTYGIAEASRASAPSTIQTTNNPANTAWCRKQNEGKPKKANVSGLVGARDGKRRHKAV